MYTVNFWGEPQCGTLMKGTYQTNGNLAILFQENDADDFDFAMTTNLPMKLPDGCALIDVNNLPEAEVTAFLVENHIAEPTGNTYQSGFVVYPEFRFYPEVLEKMEEIE